MGRGQKVQAVMRRSPRISGRVFFILLVMALANSCASGGGMSQSGSGATAVPPDAQVDDNDQNEDGTARMVGTLPNPLEYYRIHGGELYDLVKDVPWHGWFRMRDCENCVANEHTRLKIQAISNAQYDKLTPLPRYGVVRGRLINVGDNADATTHVQAQNGWFKRPDEYYFIITDDLTPGAATVSVARIEFNRFTNSPKSEVEIKTLRYKYRKCDHKDEYTGKKSEGDFKDCDKRASSLRAMPWFSCDAGCCTSSLSALE